MSGERKVMRVLSPKLGDAGWKTVRFALSSWARTARLAVLLLILSLPIFATTYIVLSRWP
jgi:hypothetical protein